MKKEGNKVTFLDDEGNEKLIVWIPKGGLTPLDVYKFEQHLLKIARESNN